MSTLLTHTHSMQAVPPSTRKLRSRKCKRNARNFDSAPEKKRARKKKLQDADVSEQDADVSEQDADVSEPTDTAPEPAEPADDATDTAPEPPGPQAQLLKEVEQLRATVQQLRAQVPPAVPQAELREEPVATPDPPVGQAVGGFIQGKQLRDALKFEAGFVTLVVNAWLGPELNLIYSTRKFFENHSTKGRWDSADVVGLHTDRAWFSELKGGLVRTVIQHNPLFPMREGSRYVRRVMADYLQDLSDGDYGFVCHVSDLLTPASEAQTLADFEQVLLPQLPQGYVVLQTAKYAIAAMDLARKKRLVRPLPVLINDCTSASSC